MWGEFWRLVREAHDASDKADNYDLSSLNAQSRQQFEALLEKQVQAAKALIDYVKKEM